MKKLVLKIQSMYLNACIMGSAFLMSWAPGVVHAAKFSDWTESWGVEVKSFWPIINIGSILAGVVFVLIGLIGALTAKRQNQPAASWQIYFMIGGVVMTVLMAFVSALGGSVTGDGSAVENSMSDWGF